MNDLEKCPNASGCPILHVDGFVENERKHFYNTNYCSMESASGYHSCKRFLSKQALDFCPDFVLPDSKMTIEEIINRYEEQED